jgi:hypothetical protein
MTISTSARAKVGYMPEVTYGVTPATPALIELPFTNFSVNLTREEYEDNSIRADRMEVYSISGNRSVDGTIDVNFCHGLYDSLLESACQNAFSTNVLKTGTTRKSFVLEEQALDIGQYRTLSGVFVDKLDVTIPASGVVTAKFSVKAKDQSALTTTTIDSDGTLTAPAFKVPFTDNDLVNGFVKEGGVAVGYLTSLTFSIDNSHTGNFALGSNVVRDFTTGLAKITGTATVTFEDAVMYNKFANGTASSLDVKLGDGTNTVEFAFPNIKYVGATKTISGQGPVTLQMPFKALKDTTSGSNIVITRS